jgi:hypothetical protein
LYFQGSGDQLQLPAILGRSCVKGYSTNCWWAIMHAVKFVPELLGLILQGITILARVSVASRMLGRPHASADPSLQR